MPNIIDKTMYQGVKKRLARWKDYPAGNYGKYALVAGLIYCDACGVRMRAVHTKNQTGKKYLYYRCDNYGNGKSLSGCVKYTKLETTDDELWNKIWALISEPGRFEIALEERISSLQAEEIDARAEIEKFEQHLLNIELERQKVITWARKEFITESDLQVQLRSLSSQEIELKRELSDMKLLTGDRADKLLQLAELYREQVKAGMEAINANLESPEQTKFQFEYRKKIVDAIVTRVEVFEDKSFRVYTEINFETMTTGVYISEVSPSRQ